MIVYRKARTEADLDEVYRLRSRVLCQELKLEREEFSSSRCGRDVFDQSAIQALALHFDLLPVGTLRLIINSPLGLPMETFCGVVVNKKERCAEVSSLAISRPSLRIAGVGEHEVLFGLLRVLFQESIGLGISSWYVILTQGMYRLIRRFGIRPLPVTGARIADRGAPYALELEDVKERLYPQHPLPEHLPRYSDIRPVARVHRNRVTLH